MSVRTITFVVFVVAIALLADTACLCGAEKRQAAKPAARVLAAKPKEFKLLDNLDYKGKPDTAPLGLVRCIIIYQEAIWKNRKAGHMPDKEAYQELVRKKNAKAGSVIVLDIEDSDNWKNFVTLVRWTHEAAPGSIVGFYDHGTETKELANSVDAFFPSLYAFDDNRVKWKQKLQHKLQQAHGMAPHKPVYPYLHPQYHKAGAKPREFIEGDYWRYQLQTARQCGANGVVLWSIASTRAGGRIPWNGEKGWWKATVKFAEELKGANP